MELKKLFFRLFSMVMAIVLMFGIMIYTPAQVAYGNDDINALNKEIEALEQAQKDLEDKISNAKDEKEKQTAIKNKAETDIALVQSQIKALDEKISIMENNIIEKEEAIFYLSQDIDANYELFKNRVRSLYMTDNLSMFAMLLGSASFSDYLAQGEILKSIAIHDQLLIEALTVSKDDEMELKKLLDEDYAELEDTKVASEYKKAELDKLLSATTGIIDEISQQEKEFLANQKDIEEQLEEAREEVDKIYASLQFSEDQFSGQPFKLPVPGYTSTSNITSYYGWRFSGTDFHTGIDFSGSYISGKPIVSSNSGKVLHVQRTYTAYRGYGMYVIVDHGGGYSTLYGHMSDIYVNAGDIVAAGTTIGAVGSTGWSTGPHLHFEIRINGNHQNPYSYLF